MSNGKTLLTSAAWRAQLRAYRFSDWRSGDAPPPGWKCSQAVVRYGWKVKEIDAFIRSELPGASKSNAPARWSDKDMRERGWRVLPYGWGYDADRTAVIFDREYRPICRVRPRGKVEIVPTQQAVSLGEGKVFLYDDGSKPRDCAETRRLIIFLVARLGLDAELLRRSILERHDLLPKARKLRELPWPAPSTDWEKDLLRNHAGKLVASYKPNWMRHLVNHVGARGVLAFDMTSGKVVRLRRPPQDRDCADWTPRPVTDADLAGAVSWLRGLGMRPNKRSVAGFIEVTAALNPCRNEGERA